MIPNTEPDMAPNAAFVILCILGEILHKNVHGSQCLNPLENLHKNKTLGSKNLLDILSASHLTYVEANNLSQKTQRGIGQTPPLKNTLEFCFLTMCLDIICSCVDAKKDTGTSMKTTTERNSRLQTDDTTLHCMILKTRINQAKNELEKQNITHCRQSEDVKDDDVSFLNATMEPFTQKRDFRFQPLPLTVAFMLGTVFGCGINILTIFFSRNRQSKKQIASLEDIQLYSKYVGETPAYCEISESIQNDKELANAGAHTEEYMEPISKNTILQKTSKSLADQDENRENNAYFALTLDRRNADGDGYNHLKPNNGRIPTSPIHKGNVDSLYHTMASTESEIAQVDDNHDGNPVILEKHPVDDCCTQSSNAESKDVQEQTLQDERPYSMCIQVRDITITGDDDTYIEMQERN